MKTPLFVFLGVVETGTDANINVLKGRLETSLPKVMSDTKFEIKGELLIVTVRPPRFCFYISFANNDHKMRSEWIRMAKDCELPWDTKPVDKSRLRSTIAYVESNGWAEYRPILDLGYTILTEMEGFGYCKVFTIPSVETPNSWKKIFGI